MQTRAKGKVHLLAESDFEKMDELIEDWKGLARFRSSTFEILLQCREVPRSDTKLKVERRAIEISTLVDEAIDSAQHILDCHILGTVVTPEMEDDFISSVQFARQGVEIMRACLETAKSLKPTPDRS